MFKSVAIATMTLSLAALAQPAGGRRGPMGPGGSPDRIEQLKTYLSLTDAQVETLRSAQKQQREAARASFMELRAKQKALRDQTGSGTSDPAAVGQLMLDMQAARAKVRASRQAANDQLVASLTPDQKAKLQTLKDAAKLAPAVREAMRFGLIEPPTPSTSDDGTQPQRMRRPGAMGFRGAQRF
jgi:Spy/CpxP family protein refolding chaperone